MNRFIFIFFAVISLLAGGTDAYASSRLPIVLHQVDTTKSSDTKVDMVDDPDHIQVVEETTSTSAHEEKAEADASGKTIVKNRGFNVGSHLGQSRALVPNKYPYYNNGFFRTGTFISAGGVVTKMLRSDYTWGYGANLSLGHYFPHARGVMYPPKFGVRVDFSAGYWRDNFDTRPILHGDVSASALFNLTNHLDGYNPMRMVDVTVLAGAGVAIGHKKSTPQFGKALSLHAGLNISFKVVKGLSLYFEPQIKMYTNGMALTSEKNSAPFLAPLSCAVGATIDFDKRETLPYPNLSVYSAQEKGKPSGFFVYAMGGIQFQNSKSVFSKVMMSSGEEMALLPGGQKLGCHVSTGFGRWFNDYFAMRFPWTREIVQTKPYYTHSVSLRLEGMLDVFHLINMAVSSVKKTTAEKSPWGVSLILGPEMGRFMKILELEEGKKLKQMRRITDHYVGLVGGVQASYQVHKNWTVFIEPRFSILPYTAPNDADTLIPQNRNYYDAYLNFNIGLQFNILKMPTRKVKSASDSE